MRNTDLTMMWKEMEESELPMCHGLKRGKQTEKENEEKKAIYIPKR